MTTDNRAPMTPKSSDPGLLPECPCCRRSTNIMHRPGLKRPDCCLDCGCEWGQSKRAPQPIPAAVDEEAEKFKRIALDCAALLRRFCYQAKRTEGDNSLKVLAGKTDEYLRRIGLAGNILRDVLGEALDALNDPTDAEIIEIRDEHLPNQGERFDCIAFARAILAARRLSNGGG